jgi:hypothetical protein
MTQEDFDKAATGFAAVQLFEHGYWPVLLRYGEKAPAFKDWQERLMNRDEIVYWTGKQPFGLGVHLGASGVCVLDKDAVSAEAYALMRQHRVHRSPMEDETNKGVHYWFLLPASVEEVRTRIRFLGNPLDVLMGLRFAVVPPTFIAATEFRYAFRKGKRLTKKEDLPPLTDSFVALLNRKEERTQPQRVVTDRLTGTIEKAHQNYVSQIDPSVEGQNGSGALIKAILKLLTLAEGDAEKAWSLVLEYNRTRCHPPWDEEAEVGPNSLRRKFTVALGFWKPR